MLVPNSCGPASLGRMDRIVESVRLSSGDTLALQYIEL